METALQVFDYEGSKVRTVEIDGETWFVGKDVATVLGYKDTDQAVRDHVDEEDKLTRQIDGSGQRRNMTFVNESGVYSLIFESKLPAAKKFKHWVTSVVLPQIHKTGSYSAKPVAGDRELRLKELEDNRTALNLERAKFLQHMIDVLAFPLTDESKAVIAHEAFKLVTGHEYLGMLPANTEQWYTASDIGELLGISANKVGRIAKEYGLKPSVGESNEYGRWIYSKSKYSPREVPSFVYTKTGLDWFMDYQNSICRES